MPTMTDVARRAGVAVSTVSNALNGTRPISDATRQRIFEAIEELGYKPHALARGLASKRSRLIALLFPSSERGLGYTEREFVTSAATAAKENQYNLVLWSYDVHDLVDLRQLIQQRLVDGVVVMEVHEHDERIDLLRKLDFPFSMIGRCADADGLDYVDIDFAQTIRDAVDYLAGEGHRRIAFLNQSQAAYDAGYGPVIRTQAGFEQTMQARGLEAVSRFCRTAPRAGYEAFAALLDSHPDLTALTTMNERAVPGVLQAIYDRGWTLPDDFSLVVIVSSGSVAEMMIPPLTTFDAMTVEMGRLGVELLIEQLENHPPERSQILLPCRLVVRRSSGAAPGRTRSTAQRR